MGFPVGIEVLTTQGYFVSFRGRQGCLRTARGFCERDTHAPAVSCAPRFRGGGGGVFVESGGGSPDCMSVYGWMFQVLFYWPVTHGRD